MLPKNKSPALRREPVGAIMGPSCLVMNLERGACMLDILTQAGYFIAIIALGYTLRRVGFFKKEDFHLLSRISIRIVLTAAVIRNFSGRSIDTSLLLLSVLGLAYGLALIGGAFVLNARQGRTAQAFAMLNSTGCNVGNFAFPFAQGFLGPAGVMAMGLLDVGNSFICLGGAYALADAAGRGGGRFSLRPVFKSLFSSPPFIAYISMTVLSLLHVSLPGPAVELAGIIANANAFLAMLMIGVGFELHAEKAQLGALARILGLRYALALVCALLSWFVVPFPVESRQAMVLFALSPISSAAPAFTARMQGDFGLASAISSLSLLISIMLMIASLTVIL